MAYCVKCGAKVEDAVRFCPYCGAEIPRMGGNADTVGNSGADYTQDHTYYQEEYGGSQIRQGYYEAAEVKRNKVMGVLSYLGILVLVPLLAGDKSSAYVKQHINQGLILFVISSVMDLLEGNWVWGFHSWINATGGWFSWVFEILDFVCLILFVMGIVSACRGTRQELPLIGKIKILK